MCGVWLVAVLATATADACSTEPFCVGMTFEDVDAAADHEVLVFAGGPARVRFVFYQRTDCLGGAKQWRMSFDHDGFVTKCEVRYRPFAACPPWLDAIRDAFGLRPPPPVPARNSV